MKLEMKTVPVIRETGHGESRGYLFSFGAYGDTHVAVIGGSLDDGLESCLDWLDDNAPGLLSTVTAEDYAEAARELGIEWPREDFDDESKKVTQAAECDMTMAGHTTLAHGNCIPSWEWHVRELEGSEIVTLMTRFCKDCEHELGENESTLCGSCLVAMREQVASDLRIERAGLAAPEESDDEPRGVDVRLQVSKWGHDWAIRIGDASSDQDHRGHWGASSLAPDDTDETVRALANDLVDQALEHAAQSDECEHVQDPDARGVVGLADRIEVIS